MGACYGKGSALKDPDQAPYVPSKGGKKKRKTSDVLTNEERDKCEEISDKLVPDETNTVGEGEGMPATDQGNDDRQRETQDVFPTRILPVVLHLPPRHNEDIPSHVGKPEARKEPAKVTQTINTPPVNQDDIAVEVTQPRLKKESPWKRTSASPGNTQPSSTQPPKPYSSFTPRIDTSVKTDTKRETNAGDADMTVTVQRQTVLTETKRASSDNTNPFEVTRAGARMENTQERRERTKVSMSTVSKTTTVINRTDITPKEVIDAKVQEKSSESIKTANIILPHASVQQPVINVLKDGYRETRTVESSTTVSHSPIDDMLTKTTPVATVTIPRTTDSSSNNSPTKTESVAPVSVLDIIRTETRAKADDLTKTKVNATDILFIKEVKEGVEKEPAPAKPTLKLKEVNPMKSASGIPSPTSPVRSTSGIPSTTRTSALPSPTSRAPVASPRASVSPDKSKLPAPEAMERTPVKPDSVEPKGRHPKEVIRNGSTLNPPPSPSKDISAQEVLKNGNADDENVPVAADMKTLSNILCDFTTERNTIMSQYIWCENTRTRLVNCIDKWAVGEDKEKEGLRRAWAVVGKPGMGKTAIAANICRKHDRRVIGAHFFHHTNPTVYYNDARYTVLSLAFQMCTKLPKYTCLLQQPQQLKSLVDRGDLMEMFDVLIRQPLCSEELHHDPDDTALLVLDAVDECNMQTRSQLLQLINTFSNNMPDWLYLLITTRDENQILSQLDNLRSMEIKATNDNMVDIKKYLKEPMGKHMDRISLDGGLTQLTKRTDGNFLCARVLGGMLDQFPSDKKIALREVDGIFPKGLSCCYTAVFKAFKESLSALVPTKELDHKYQSIIGLLCCSLEHVHTEFLDNILKVSSDVIIHSLRPVLDIVEGCYIGFHHKHTIDWLQSEPEAGEFHVNIESSQRKLANWCTSFLENLRNKSDKSISKEIEHYTLKHVIWHLLDVPKQQNNIADLLCDLNFIQNKLQVPGVRVRHLLLDYQHMHSQGTSDGMKPITMAEYMRKHPKLSEQMNVYQQFVTDLDKEFQLDPSFVFLIAANYTGCERIQQNARVELEDKHWLEDRTALPATHSINKPFNGQALDIDLSPDGKTIALLTMDGDCVLLYLINMATFERKTEAIDISTLKDRIGLCVKFLADNTAVFVGSLTTFLSVRQGKPTVSGFQANAIQVREKYDVECCDISKKFIVCGLSTLPGGGRSLHLAILDLKSKKCAKTIEVLKFRFGGSAQFGIKSCAISEDETMMCSLSKQSNKPHVVCTLWSLSKFTTLHTVDVERDNFTRCLFVSNASVLIGTGIRSWMNMEENQKIQERSKIWNFKGGKNATNWDDHEMYSVVNANRKAVIGMKWYIPGNRVSVQKWPKKNVQQPAAQEYTLRGLPSVYDVVSDDDRFIVVTKGELKLYNINDLEVGLEGQGSTIFDVLFRSTAFHPRNEEVILTHVNPTDGSVRVSTMSPTSEDLSLIPSPINDEGLSKGSRGDTSQYFHATASKADICQVNNDGNIVVFNNGRVITVWNRIDNSLSALPASGEEKAAEPENNNDAILWCVVSQKDNIIGVVHAGIPHKIGIFDLKSRKRLRQIETTGSSEAVSDLTFMPSNGYLASFYEGLNNSLILWNQRNGNVISKQEGLRVSYIRLSPASDRLVLSNQDPAGHGQLILRNSDGKFSNKLKFSASWIASNDASDVEFAADGTILVGVCTETKISRVWNAGNGEVLRDLDVTFDTTAEVVGMVTNTHVIFHDNCLRIVDVSTGVTVAVYPLGDAMMTKTHPTGMRVSAKGSAIICANELGQLKVIQCHNFTSVKRTTTLQRMKSFIK